MVRRDDPEDQRQQDRFHRILKKDLEEGENRFCADCGGKGPRWASWNLGAFLCTSCAGIHRNLGVHISKVKSVNLDRWTQEQIDTFQAQGGNANVNAYYEASLPKYFRRPTPASVQELERFIRAKYERKEYVDRAGQGGSNSDDDHYRSRAGRRSRTSHQPSSSNRTHHRAADSVDDPFPLYRSHTHIAGWRTREADRYDSNSSDFDSERQAPDRSHRVGREDGGRLHGDHVNQSRQSRSTREDGGYNEEKSHVPRRPRPKQVVSDSDDDNEAPVIQGPGGRTRTGRQFVKQTSNRQSTAPVPSRDTDQPGVDLLGIDLPSAAPPSAAERELDALANDMGQLKVEEGESQPDGAASTSSVRNDILSLYGSAAPAGVAAAIPGVQGAGIATLGMQMSMAMPGMPISTQGVPGMPLYTQAMPGMPVSAQSVPGMQMFAQSMPGMVLSGQQLPSGQTSSQNMPGMPTSSSGMPGLQSQTAASGQGALPGQMWNVNMVPPGGVPMSSTMPGMGQMPPLGVPLGPQHMAMHMMQGMPMGVGMPIYNMGQVTANEPTQQQKMQTATGQGQASSAPGYGVGVAGNESFMGQPVNSMQGAWPK